LQISKVFTDLSPDALSLSDEKTVSALSFNEDENAVSALMIGESGVGRERVARATTNRGSS
jgi:transcriptional regulator with GAF, ATPase, and Fis domain